MSKINAVLILGCSGYKSEDDEEFIFCHGSHNVILKLHDLDDTTYHKIIEFLDGACDLFTSPIRDFNKCSNILNLLYKNYKVISPEMLSKIQYYLTIHKRCNPYLILLMEEDYYGK